MTEHSSTPLPTVAICADCRAALVLDDDGEYCPYCDGEDDYVTVRERDEDRQWAIETGAIHD